MESVISYHFNYTKTNLYILGGHFWEVWQYYFVFYWLATKALCLYCYFEKGYQKKCMWQYCKVLCAVLSSLFYKEIFKNGSGDHGLMFASAKGNVWQLQCREQGIDHIPYYLSGLWQAQIFPTTFLKIAVCINCICNLLDHW